MRPLKRPMFKTGGPIKEGVMNGLRDGGVATTMADATMMAGGGMPNMRGRVTGPGGYAGKKKRSFFKPTLGGVTGSVGLDYYVDPQPYLNLLQAIGGFKDGGPVGPGLVGDPRYPQQGGRAMHNEYLKNIYQKATPIVKGFFSPKKYTKKAKAIQKVAGNVPGMLKSAVQQAGPGIMSTRQALIKNLKDFNVPYGSKIKDFAVAAGQKALKYPKTSAVGALGLTSDTARDVYGAIGDAGKSIAGNLTPGWLQRLFTPTPKEPPPPPPPGSKDTGGPKPVIPKVKTQAEIDAEKEADDKKKLDRIYSLLGVKRAQANAASKALIDMSRYIDEGGKDVISKKNLGSTISKGISAFDKRLDKADQLKEAAGLMMAKGEIQAMMDPYSKELKKTTIDVNRRKLADADDASQIKARFQSTAGGGLTSTQAAKATAQSLYKDKYVGDIVDDDTFTELIKDNTQKGKSEREIVVSVISKIAETQAKPDGIYTAGDVIFEIKNQAVSQIIAE